MSKQTKTVSTFSWSKVLRVLSYWSVVLIGIALLLSKIIPTSIGASIQLIGNVLAYIVVLASSFGYAMYKRNLWYFLIWAVALVLIVVFVILAL
ncbi:MAG: hypothetical protein IJA61_01855 [Clostridia bacterium]|nr:hypothetical protein [Clostridia bacterium]